MTSDLLEENQDLRKQIEELKDQIATRNGKLAILISENERLKAIVLGNEEEIFGLKNELKKWKDEWQEQVQKANDEGYARTLQTIQLNKQTIQLNKAKEIIKTCLGFMQTFGYSPSMDKFVTEAEQFIKEN